MFYFSKKFDINKTKKNSMDKKIIILFMLFLPLTSLFSQTQTTHIKRIYTNPQGKVYINKELPLYFKLSIKPDTKSDKYLLKSKDNPQYTNPTYFTTEGLNTVYSPSAVDTTTHQTIMPKQNVYFQIYVDGTAPVTATKNNSTPYEKNKDTIFFGVDLEMKLPATDNVAGVEKTYYSIDGEAFKEYNAPLKFPTEKSYVLKYYSVDFVGNREDVKELKFTIDATKPLTNLKINGDYINNIISGTATISLKQEDAFAGSRKTYYVLDKNTEQVYINPITASSITEGEHTLTYKTVDNVQNEEESKAYNFFVDKTAPIVVDEILGDSFFANGKEYSSGRTKLKLTAIDNRAGVKSIYYSINNAEYLLYDKPFSLPLQTGNISVKYYAVDNVNNKTVVDTKNKLLFYSYMDLSGPELSHGFVGQTYKMHDTTYINKETKIVLKATDSEAGLKNITYSLDFASEQDYNEPFSVSGNGLHTIDINGYDNVNNSNQISTFFKVDETGPEIFTTFSVAATKTKNNSKVYPPQLKIYLSAQDKTVGVDKIYYSLNNSVEMLATATITNFIAGENILKIRAIDLLGNESRTEIVFHIE